MPQLLSRPESVHLSLFPSAVDITGEIRDREQALQVRSDWDYLFTVREQALRQLEVLRNDKTIKANLEARVLITASGEDYKRLAQYADKLAAFFVVSQVEVRPSAATSNASPDTPIAFEVFKAEGVKCERCWNFSTHVGEDATYPTVCERCSVNVPLVLAERAAADSGSASA
jgi:isoleucyl-tRNA synthetase